MKKALPDNLKLILGVTEKNNNYYSYSKVITLTNKDLKEGFDSLCGLRAEWIIFVEDIDEKILNEEIKPMLISRQDDKICLVIYQCKELKQIFP